MLPTIIFISALFAVLYHLGIMQIVIRGFAWGMQRTMRISGAEILNVAASIFMGQTEAPLTIRPFLPTLTRSELMTIMTSGMAHVSGGIMAAYILYGIEAKHLLAAVIMTAPGTILIAKMLVPETEMPATLGVVHVPENEEHHERKLARRDRARHHRRRPARLQRRHHAHLFRRARSRWSTASSAACTTGSARTTFPFPPPSTPVLGALFAPIAWLIGIPWHDAPLVGNLLGTRMVINELIAYSISAQQKSTLDPRSFTIATFALCGFANFSSIGIQIGGIGALIPERRNELARLGLRAMLAGTMANLMSASIVGILI